MTVKQFEQDCFKWLASSRRTARAFSVLVGSSFVALGTVQRELAEEFEVAISTVSRWASGLARPHPRLQKQIVQALARRAAECHPGAVS
jgi:hypothetical protein